MGVKHVGVGIGLAAALAAGVCGAAETRLMVRARTKDAKFIGTSMGGALVVVRNAGTGEILASGLTSGGTGDTKRIISDPHVRGAQITDAATAGFEAKLDLAEPTFVTVEVSGPMGQRQSTAKATVQTWLIPGKNVSGDGLMVEIPGFAVNIASPRAQEVVALDGGRAWVPLAANVVMMCGCPTTPGGLWNALKYEVKALVKLDGQPVGAVTLGPGQTASSFKGTLEVATPGTYEITLYAFDPANGNAGVDSVAFMVR